MRPFFLAIVLFFTLPLLTAHYSKAADQVQFFPPAGPCNAENPILAWDGSGTTYCTHFPTAAIDDCKDGEYLTKKNGNLVCAKFNTGAVSSSTSAAPAAPVVTTPVTKPAPTTAYNSNGTPTGLPLSVAATGGSSTVASTTSSTPTAPATTPYTSNGTATGIPQNVAATSGGTYANPVVRTGNAACPDITVPSCASDSVLVNYGLDFNGCQTSPQCKYVGNAATATAIYTSYYSSPYYLSTYSSAPVYTTPVYASPTYTAPTYYEPSYAVDPSYTEEGSYSGDGSGGDGGG